MPTRYVLMYHKLGVHTPYIVESKKCKLQDKNSWCVRNIIMISQLFTYAICNISTFFMLFLSVSIFKCVLLNYCVLSGLQVVGRRAVIHADKKTLPYIEATIMEIQRCSSLRKNHYIYKVPLLNNSYAYMYLSESVFPFKCSLYFSPFSRNLSFTSSLFI